MKERIVKRLSSMPRVGLLAVLLVLAMTVMASAWYFTATTLDMGEVSGGVDYIAKYFESGEGTEEYPFEIATPEQMYNLAWLQYMGYFNETDENGYIAPTYFYISDKYLDGGTTFDMGGMALPPIGTSAFPFVGVLDGSGLTVTNLTITNVVDTDHLQANDLPLEIIMKDNSQVSGVEIIGFVGVIGELPGNASYTYASSVTAMKNLTLDNITVETQTDTALIGLAAGYVNGTLENVGVSASTITIKSGTAAVDAENLTANMSDYALVGYCTDDYKVMVKQADTEDLRYLVATEPMLINQELDAKTSGNDAAFGGSIDMESLYNRLLAARNSSTRATYVSAETRTVDVNGNSTTTRTTNANGRILNHPWDGIGQYSFALYNQTVNENLQWLYLYGEDVIDPEKTVTTTYTYQGYYISNVYNGTTYYLNATTTGVSASTSTNNRTLWVFENNTVYCWINNTKYYLRYNGTSLSMSSTTSTTWTYDENTGYLYYSNSNYALHCVDGQWIVTNTATGEIDDTSAGYFYIKINNQYLTAAENNTSATLSNSISNDARWTTNNNYIVRYGTTNNYLNRYSGTNPVYVSNTANNRYYLYEYDSTTTYLYTGYYYLRYNNGLTTATRRNQATAVTIEYPQVTITYDKNITRTSGTGTYTLTTTESSTYNSLATFFPLSLNEEGTGVRDSNTGYIVSGPTFQNTSTQNGVTNVPPSRSGDIRVSYYAMDNISNALGRTNNTTYSDNRLEVVTCTEDAGWVRISDSYNANNTNINATLSNAFGTKSTVASLGLQQYNSVRDSISTLLTGQSNIYGLHFMDAAIGTSTVTVPSATINGDTFTNYPLPSDCIDFNLNQAGYITFVAGTYFPGNTAFFSLYQIDRDEDTQAINSIQEISKIYASSTIGADYIYLYKDGSYSDTLDGTYSEVFDTAWITNPTIVQNAVYYFEIPVNTGEYALGSVSGEDGAYLLYLDIGANGRITSENAWIGATADVAITEDRVNRYGVPAGVDFVPVSAAVGDPEATAALTGSGTISFVRSSDAIASSGDVTDDASFVANGELTYLYQDGTTRSATVGATYNGADTAGVKPDTYNETDYTDANNTVLAFDTYGVTDQTVTKTVTVRVHDDITNIEDQFTFTYSYTNTGAEDVDPVTVSYADPLVYMIQYDSARVTSAPTVSSVETGFKGTIYIGLAGENSTLTQYNGTKTVRPSDKVCFEAYPATELFRVEENDTDTTSLDVSYSSVLNATDKTQAFTYTVTGSDLEEPVTTDATVTATSAASATLTWTLVPADDATNGTNAFHAPSMLSLTPGSMMMSVGAPASTETENGPELDGSETSAPTVVDNTPIEPMCGSRKEYNEDEGVTRYYEYNEETGEWDLVLEIYDPGREPIEDPEEPIDEPEDPTEPDPGEEPEEPEDPDPGENPEEPVRPGMDELLPIDEELEPIIVTDPIIPPPAPVTEPDEDSDERA